MYRKVPESAWKYINMIFTSCVYHTPFTCLQSKLKLNNNTRFNERDIMEEKIVNFALFKNDKFIGNR